MFVVHVLCDFMMHLPCVTYEWYMYGVYYSMWYVTYVGCSRRFPVLLWMCSWT